MTLPTLIKNYQKKVTAVRVKSAYSQVMQAIQRSEVDNGEFKSWNFVNSTSNIASKNTAFMEQYIEPYFKGMKLCSKDICQSGISSNDRRYLLNNGTEIDFYTNYGYLHFMVDVNNIKGKNTMGYDKFYFCSGNSLNRLLPFGWYEGVTRNNIFTGYNFNDGGSNHKIYCKASSGTYDRHACTLLLMMDGWEFKDDYPW